MARHSVECLLLSWGQATSGASVNPSVLDGPAVSLPKTHMPLKLSQLLARVGDENLKFQMLESSFKSAQAGKKEGTITFYTDKENVMDLLSLERNQPPKHRCFIVWVPAGKMEQVLKESDETEASSNG